MLSNFYRLDLHNENIVLLTNLQWSIIKIWIEILVFYDLVYGYHKHMFADFLIEHTSPPN